MGAPKNRGVMGRVKKITWTCDLCATLNRGIRIRCRACNLARKPNALKRWIGMGERHKIKGKLKAVLEERKKRG